MRIFEDHDGVVHDETGCQHEREQGEQVDGESHQPDAGHHAHKGDRNRCARHDRGTPRPEEQQHRADHDENGEAERDQHLPHRDADEFGIVRDDVDGKIGKPLVKPVNALPDAVRYLDRVRACLPHNAQAHDRTPVEAHEVGCVGGRETGFGNVAHARGAGNHHILDQRGIARACFGPHHQFLCIRSERADRHIVRGVLQRVGDICQRKTEAVESCRIDRHAHLPCPGAELLDARHPFGSKQFRDDVVLDDAGELGLVVFGRLNRQRHDRLGILVGLDHGHLFHPLGQLAVHAAYRLAHVGGRRVEVYAGIEFDPDARIVLLAGGTDLAHSRNAGDRILEKAGDLRIHRLGCGTG